MMKIPENYRKLKPAEYINPGDYYESKEENDVGIMHHEGGLVSAYSHYNFYRRRHVKKVTRAVRQTSADAVINQVAKDIVKKTPVAVVTFGYPHKDYGTEHRTVQLISLDDTYLTGLEITSNVRYGKTKYQFKKFLRSRISNHGTVYLQKFGPRA
jgi:hypothetical protein